MPKRFGFGFLEDAVEAVVTGDVPQKSNKLWIIMGVVLLLLIIVFTFLLFKSNFGDTSNNAAKYGTRTITTENIPHPYSLRSYQNGTCNIINKDKQYLNFANNGSQIFSPTNPSPNSTGIFTKIGNQLLYQGRQIKYSNNNSQFQTY
jgi:hypothetical protein